MRLFPRNYKVLLLIFVMAACIEPYEPPVDDTNVNYLVINGFINASTGIATVSLTRTLPVASTEMVPSEAGAFVSIEDDNGIATPLTETGNGEYAGPLPNVGFQTKYRLLVRTSGNDAYASEFISIKETPPIDSINYFMVTGGMKLAVNTHDATGTARCFRWRFSETYEYNSRFNSLYMFDGGLIVPRQPELSIFTCWKTNPSTGILVASTERLTESEIINFPITFIPERSIKVSTKYSILVQQQALTEEAYNYWSNLEKSTEHLGGLFDPLPSEVKGNIHNTEKPAETVIGFFGGATVQEKRIFLRPWQLPPRMTAYQRDPNCKLDTIPVAEVANVTGSLLVDALFAPGAGIVAYTTSWSSCVDCRYLGGTVLKPEFWKD